MATSIGEKLRVARETRGIALRDISEQTRISMRYLEAIETDDYRRLPGGIFNRSFIRAYAKHIGYDEQQALEEYSTMMHEHGESTDEVPTTPVRSLVYTDDGGSRSPLMTALLAVIILAVLSLCVWAAWYFYEHRVRRKTQAPSHASQSLAVDRNLITIQNAIAAAQSRVMEPRNPKEDKNEPVA
ncbi:MAG TPA: helix-turn-helix domain-containing protein [Pyrinomonadaceae bacterium]|nr:helix-turn-helix domain-containing protein [Pyrinomonadaceae bacterium]